MSRKETKGAEKPEFILIGTLLAVTIGLLITVVVLLVRKGPEAEKESGVYVMGEGNYSQIKEEMSDRVSEGYFETYMTMNWIFPDGSSEASDALLGNSPNNVKPIRCEVLLSDTGEKVFSTGVIPVGAQLPAIRLDTDLDAGVYGAVCRIYLLDEMEDGTYKDYSDAGFQITITVQN